jgi:hypothetical protein
MDLLQYIREHGELDQVPNGMHAVVPAQPELGLEPGVIFALRNRNDSVHESLHNRLQPYYLVYIGENGKVITNHSEVKKLLDLLRGSCKGEPEPLMEVCHQFNELTEEGRHMNRYSDLLSGAIRSMIDVKEEHDIDSLFTGGQTTALVDTIRGLDDFELIAFLVIMEGG